MSPPNPRPAVPHRSNTAATWRPEGRRFHDDRGDVVATLDLDVPAHGIQLPSPALSTATGTLGLDLGGQPHLADHWVRGSDVTAVYESHDARQLRTLAMWRLQPGPADKQAWVLVLSAQTALLETLANVGVVSRVLGAPLRHFGSGTGHNEFVADGGNAETKAVLVRLAAADGVPADALRSLLVAIHPEDRGQLTASASPGLVDICCRLFPTPLEKGVLLRSRVLAAVGPRANDVAWATDLCTEFAASPPLLST